MSEISFEGLSGRRLLIGANEAGAASLLAALASRWRPAAGSLALVTPVGAPYFAEAPLSTRIVDVDAPAGDALAIVRQVEPEFVVVGASAGPSIERHLIDAARATHRPVVSFVDHYWNLWQRFADESTARRWRYVPDVIFVPAESCARRLRGLGAPTAVSVFEHPLMHPASPEVARRSRDEARRHLGIPEGAFTLLFVSEYTFPESSLWQWEQPTDADIAAALRLTLCVARDLEARGRAAFVLVKLHPSEHGDWGDVRAEFPPGLARVVQRADKEDLVVASDVALGLNSMLLLEMARAGLPALSYHGMAGDRDAWLSTIHPEIVEVAGFDDAARRVSALVGA